MERVEALVVGGGPVGLFLAGELRRRGRTALLIERNAGPSTYSKALAVMPGTMEMFETCGIAERFADAANRIDGVRFGMPRRSVFVPFYGIQSRYNYISILPQWKTEELLAGYLRESGGDVCYDRTLVALKEQNDGVDATIATPDGTQTVRASYVVGCDGVYSTVREQSGIAFNGGTYPGTALLADVALETPVPRNEARVHVYSGGVVTMFPMDERVRRIVVIAPQEVLPQEAGAEWLQRRLTEAGYAGTAIESVLWSSSFRVHRRVASAMRSGRALIAGDAAHTHSPVGGQGMNVGLHDAWNLARKLSRVISGDAPESLIDTYERERLPVAKRVVRRTDLLTRALVHPNPLLRVARERIAPAVAGLPVVYGPLIRSLSLTA